jgi:hypothetical protein
MHHHGATRYHMALVVYNIQHLFMLMLFNYKTYEINFIKFELLISSKIIKHTTQFLWNYFFDAINYISIENPFNVLRLITYLHNNMVIKVYNL